MSNPWDSDPIVQDTRAPGPVVRIPASAKTPHDERLAILNDEWQRARTPADRAALSREIQRVGGQVPATSPAALTAAAGPMRGPWDNDPTHDARGGAAPLAGAGKVDRPDPTEGMSTFDLARAGAGKWLADAGRGIKQRLDEGAAALESMVPGGAEISRATGGKTAAQIRDEGQAEIDESKRLDAPLMRRGPAIAGNIAAGAAVTAPITARMSPAGAGAVMGALAPTASDESVITNTAVGAAGGWAGDKILRGAARVLSPNVDPQVRKLADAGVQMTPGQILGGAANRIEEKATSIPILGDMIVKARGRSVDGLNRAVADRVLEPLGRTLPEDVATGRDALEYVGKAIGQHYDRALSGVTVKADRTFVREVQTLVGMVQGGNLPPPQAEQFARILDDQVMGRFMGQNALTGRTFKDIESNLGRLASDYGSSADAGQRQLGGAIRELQSSLRDLVARTNPAQAQDLKAANSAWADFIRMQRAAGMTGADEGVFTPGMLQRAVRAADRSRNKGAFARGDARMQDLSDAAKNVLGDRVPDSGTAGRVLNAAVLGGGAVLAPKTLAAGAVAAAPYTRAGGAAVQHALIDRPEAAITLGNGVRALAPAGAAAGGQAPLTLRDGSRSVEDGESPESVRPPPQRQRPSLSSFYKQ